MKRAWIIFRYLLYTTGVLILAINLFILLSGRTYLYNVIAKTYLIGKTGPGIYDYSLFPNAIVEKSNQPFEWFIHPKASSIQLPDEKIAYLEDMKTRAFLVIRKDSVLYEHYWGGHSKETTSNSFSMAKTIVSLLVGIAIDEGKIKSIDEPVYHYISAFKENGRDVVTIRHLLTMSAGFDWDESGTNPLSETAEGYYGSDLESLVTRRRVIEKPGKVFHYQSLNTQVLSMVLEKATGNTIADYAAEKLWKPLGAEKEATWSMDRENGDEKAYCCFYATARDFALLGRLLLNRGEWNGKRIISADYIDKMTTADTSLLTVDGISNLVYGLHMWTYYNNGNPVHYFRGLLGQYIMVIPKENTIIIRLGERTDKNFKLHRLPILPKEINSFDYLVGHSVDILEYLKIKEIVLNQAKNN
ncbi:MAG: serine hydrolase [Bacteroidetes bacterium]|nr:serine hydrolase [Bacteroidota bacterium]